MLYNPNENNDFQNTENDSQYPQEYPTIAENYSEPANLGADLQSEDTSAAIQEEATDEYIESSVFTNPYGQPPVTAADNNISADNQRQPAVYDWYDRTSDNSVYMRPSYSEPDFTDSKKNRQKQAPLALIILICMVVSVIFGSGSAIIVNKMLDENDTVTADNKTSATETVAKDDVAEDKDGNNSFIAEVAPLTDELSTIDIVDKYADSVVEIVTEYVQTGAFSQQYIKSGAGSGVIIDSDGYIVTNHHVIESAQRISITLRDGTILEAELLGSDAKMDLALLKVDGANLSSAVIGDSDTLKVGQRTIAIGNPLGQLGGTVTEGIISALDRNVTVDGQTMNLMQTDTAINPGNSGGGLFDGKGNLIGVVVAKSSGSEVEGLGFAIPINDAVEVISDLKEYGYVRGRVSIGMEFLDVVSEPVAWMYGLDSLGCYVYSVDRNSNADEAGFESGDLILKIDGETVETSEDVEKLLEDKKVGDVVEFTVKRGRSQGSLSLTLEEYNPNKTTSGSNLY